MRARGPRLSPRRRHDRPERVVLTARERQIVSMVMEGKPNRAIALRLGTSAQTVKNQLSALYKKVGVSGRVPLAVLAVRKGWLERKE